ncbi:MAG: polymerase beta domain protein region [Phycisphaerales bacterium]|nr:polymerase beta domain protein region [Phycisphaerales bacterium]
MDNAPRPASPSVAVINDLVTAWKSNPAVEAVILFGSHAHGTAGKNSDIDFYILTQNVAAVSGDGMYFVHGFLIEAFINTRAYFEGHFERFHADNSRIGQSQFASGIILFDRTNEGWTIQQTAREWLAKPRIGQTSEQAYWPKRMIWSRFVRLEDMVRRGQPALLFVLRSFAYDVYRKYAAFLGQPVIPTDQIEDYLSNAAHRKQYLLDPFPDAEFATMLRSALRPMATNDLFELVRRIKDHALAAMGGFEVKQR